MNYRGGNTSMPEVIDHPPQLIHSVTTFIIYIRAYPARIRFWPTSLAGWSLPMHATKSGGNCDTPRQDALSGGAAGSLDVAADFGVCASIARISIRFPFFRLARRPDAPDSGISARAYRQIFPCAHLRSGLRTGCYVHCLRWRHIRRRVRHPGSGARAAGEHQYGGKKFHLKSILDSIFARTARLDPISDAHDGARASRRTISTPRFRREPVLPGELIYSCPTCGGIGCFHEAVRTFGTLYHLRTSYYLFLTGKSHLVQA